MNWIRKTAVLLVLGLATAAWASTPTTTDQSAADYHLSPAEAQQLFRSIDDILRFDSLHTGLPIQHAVKKKLATRAEVAAFVEKRLKEQGNDTRFDREVRSLKRLGLLPPSFNLRQYMLDLYKEQVEGWYDTHSKTVYLLDWVEPELQKPVMAHELVHALQDQNYDLEKWLDVAHDTGDDRQQLLLDEQRAARQAVVEGQAMVALFDYQLAGVGQTVATAPELVEAMRATIAEDSTSLYAQAPIYLREALLFPYGYGLNFVRAVLAARGIHAAFAGVFQQPPANTRQVMQPAIYLAGETLPMATVPALAPALGSGWRTADLSGLGEFDLRVLLLQWGGEAAAAKLTPAWRGGYYLALSPPQASKSTDWPLVLVLHFASEEAAARFAVVYASALPKRYTAVVAQGDNVWNTAQGRVELVRRGTTVVALESFTAEQAERLRNAVLASATSSEKKEKQ